MDREFLEALACPRCFGPLDWTRSSDHSENGVLVCQSDRLRFRVEADIACLIRPERRDAVDGFSAAYSQVWQAEGWGSENSDYLLQLPYRDVTERQSAKWRVKARSLKVLLRVLQGIAPGSVLDLGAGTGWLSYRLTRAGYRVYALDVLMSPVLGLGAAQAYLEAGAKIWRVQGEMERIPLRAGSMDVIVANASLHYASSLEEVLSQVDRVLSDRGRLIIMNSPVHGRSDSAIRAQTDMRSRLETWGAPSEVTDRYHHFVRSDLRRALEDQIGTPREVPFNPGLRFRLVRRGKGVVLGMELASFPVLMAAKEGADLPDTRA